MTGILETISFKDLVPPAASKATFTVIMPPPADGVLVFRTMEDADPILAKHGDELTIDLPTSRCIYIETLGATWMFWFEVERWE